MLFTISVIRAQGTAAIAQGFKTSESNIATGALMSLKQDTPSAVELANQDRAEHLVGVIGDRPLIQLDEGDASVQVVTGGITLTLVSDINGEVKTGDKITASPIDGIGMKATRSVMVVGTAQADLSSATLSERQIIDTDGKTQTVKVSAIPVQINVTFYAAPDDSASFLPVFLQDFANNIAGHQVSPVRVIVSALLMFLAFLCIAVLLYASVRSSIISIGRNPLSESAVRKGLLEVSLTTIGILLLTLIAIYLILTT